ncbi:hypothetical protein [Peribacillus loiseleuriae]|uniref:hypothetical protein n=1 Tax=Peribacillus loiseleuriae TaxID=1679170 RepID=UPI00069E0332|nr:hypothetical protein [Peribacillus loiseleuriae]
MEYVFYQAISPKESGVVTSLMDVTVEEIAAMHKSSWAIESFFRWIKQNLNVSVLFGTGTTSNALFN